VRNFESKFADALVQQHQQGARQKATADRGTSGARTVADTTAASTASSAEQEQHALLSERVLLLSGALRSYVGSEAQCVKFLSERVEAAQGKLATARKELLAYAALSMKVRFCSCNRFRFYATNSLTPALTALLQPYQQGSIVQTTEAAVTQLSAEIAEDQHAVRQLLQNVAEALGQMRSMQAALNPPVTGKCRVITLRITCRFRRSFFFNHAGMYTACQR
jgi:hypothetical protein